MWRRQVGFRPLQLKPVCKINSNQKRSSEPPPGRGKNKTYFVCKLLCGQVALWASCFICRLLCVKLLCGQAPQALRGEALKVCCSGTLGGRFFRKSPGRFGGCFCRFGARVFFWLLLVFECSRQSEAAVLGFCFEIKRRLPQQLYQSGMGFVSQLQGTPFSLPWNVLHFRLHQLMVRQGLAEGLTNAFRNTGSPHINNGLQMVSPCRQLSTLFPTQCTLFIHFIIHFNKRSSHCASISKR